MADSGLDVNSCFFSEEQSEDNIECSTFSSPVYDLTKRKVRALRVARLRPQEIHRYAQTTVQTKKGNHVAGVGRPALSSATKYRGVL